jgi:hypothetical protein
MSKDDSVTFYDMKTGKDIVTLSTLKTSGIESSGKMTYGNRKKDNTLRDNILKYLLEYRKGFDVHLEFETPIDNDEKLAAVKNNYLDYEFYGIGHSLGMKDGKVIVHISELVD